MIRALVISDKSYLFDALSSIEFSGIEFSYSKNLLPEFDLIITDTEIKFEDIPVIEFIKRPIIFNEVIQEIESYLNDTIKKIKFYEYELDLISRKLSHADKTIQLTEVECNILGALMHSEDHSISKEKIKTSVLGYNEEVQTSAIENHIYHLRQKLCALDIKLAIERSENGYKLAV
ncbi:MAG: transcriptional regulatory, terminal family protein [Candidatus Midichloriaceae bacterium]|jgi:DNA-binding response OmpR family regulator|nr:transcriptional regulatory, terminal family protein [Candidatus Midichloriaceae bacterium]